LKGPESRLFCTAEDYLVTTKKQSPPAHVAAYVPANIPYEVVGRHLAGKTPEDL